MDDTRSTCSGTAVKDHCAGGVLSLVKDHRSTGVSAIVNNRCPVGAALAHDDSYIASQQRNAV
jgi:hypothetical protein